jgi:hypothetical protein
MWSHHYPRTSQEDGSEGNAEENFTSAADGTIPTKPYMESGVAGDDPVEAAKIMMDQKAADALAKAKQENKELEEAVTSNMEKYNNALTATFNEIMYGVPKKEEKKE